MFKDAESVAAKEFVKAAGSIDDIKFLTTSNDDVMKGMAIPVVEFSREGYKIRKIFAKKSTYPKEIVKFGELD